MNAARPATVLAGLALLAGCAAQVTLQGHTVREGRARVEQAAEGVASVREVTISFTPGVRQQLQAQPRFDADAFLEAVARELAARGQLDAAGEGLELEILLDTLDVQPAGEPQAAGTIAGTLGARVRLLAADSVEQRSFNVLAKANVELRRNDPDSNALQPLYRRFARQLGDELGGATR